MTRVVLNPVELRLVAGVLRDCAAEAELADVRLRAEPLPELPPGMAGVAGDVQAVRAALRRQAVELGAQGDDLVQRATRIEADQARAFAFSQLIDPTLCDPRRADRKESYWDGVRHRAGLLYDFFLGDDLHTVGDSEAPLWLRGVSLLGIAPIGKPIKLARVGGDALSAERKGDRAAEAARAARARYTQAEWRAAAGSRSHASRQLNASLREAGIAKPQGYEAHHIVSPFDPDAAPAQRILARFGIGPNDVDNGVHLPGPRLNDAEPLPTEALHRPVHTDRYYRIVNDELLRAKSREDALEILTDIRARLQANSFPR